MLAVFGEIAAGIQQQALQLHEAVAEEEKVEKLAEHVGRPRRGDFRVLADDQRVGVMARVAPAVIEAFAQRHESAEMEEGVVDPPGLERCPVRQLMVAVVGGGIENAIDKERRHRPPRAPSQIGDHTGGDQQRQPQAEEFQGRSVGPPDQFLELLAVDGTGIPGLLDLVLEFVAGKRRRFIGILAFEAVVFPGNSVHAASLSHHVLQR